MKRKKRRGVNMFAGGEKIAWGYCYYSTTGGKVPPCDGGTLDPKEAR